MPIIRHLAALAVLAACSLTSVSARAAAPDYDYIDLKLVQLNMPAALVGPGRGYGVDFDWELPAHILVGASYTHLKYKSDYSFYVPNIVERDESFSLGYKFTLAEDVALDVRLVHESSYIHQDGYVYYYYPYPSTRRYNSLAFELRDQILDHLEVHGGFSHVRAQGGGGYSNAVNLGLLCPITRLFALGADISNEPGSTTATLSARFQF